MILSARTDTAKARRAESKRADSPAASGPRKRRKRTLGGAAEDCFTCAARDTKCDRRRPFCSPCLDLGRQCSGYKTTLTWGVGVASRGKLRGMSLPVMDSKHLAFKPPPQSSSVRNVRVQEGDTSACHSHLSQDRSDTSTASEGEMKASALSPTAFFRLPRFGPVSSTFPPPVSQQGPHHTLHHAPNNNWPSTESRNLQMNRHPHPYFLDPPGMLPDVYRNASEMTAARTTASELGNSVFVLSGAESGSTVKQRPYPALSAVTADEFDTVGTGMTPSNSAPGSLTQSVNLYPNGRRPGSVIGAPSTDPPGWGMTSVPKDLKAEPEDDDTEERPPDQAVEAEYAISTYGTHKMTVSTPFPTISTPWSVLSEAIGQTPRVQYLIKYYAEVICPVIVAFDGPTNPFRTSILELAKHSETLQHAIAALSSNNLRQRIQSPGLSTAKTPHSWRSSQAHRVMTEKPFQEQLGLATPEDQAREETFHKAVAIKSLNAQIADPIQRRADQVLATLLILCLLDTCDTGVAKFQAQFAGVRKLLAARGDGGFSSEDVRWYTRIFAWFDALVATTNNHESQLAGRYLGPAALADEAWALEALTGCDARLFKIIAQLGRLNILSQGKPVEPCGVTDAVDTAALPPSMIYRHPFLPPHKGYQIDHGHDFTSQSNACQEDPRTDFWREWHTIRGQLESWHLNVGGNSTTTGSSSPPTTSPANSASSTYTLSPPASLYSSSVSSALDPATDHVNISESFRFSALLYLERLANPQVPSTHPRIQSLVHSSLYYISKVKSDAYLLWPLFITGSECTQEDQRAIVRERCKDIQKDSGFVNNLSCLGILEKVWAGDGEETAGNRTGVQWFGPAGTVSDPTHPARMGGQAFRWRRVIDQENLDGEYIVV